MNYMKSTFGEEVESLIMFQNSLKCGEIDQSDYEQLRQDLDQSLFQEDSSRLFDALSNIWIVNETS